MILPFVLQSAEGDEARGIDTRGVSRPDRGAEQGNDRACHVFGDFTTSARTWSHDPLEQRLHRARSGKQLPITRSSRRRRKLARTCRTIRPVGFDLKQMPLCVRSSTPAALPTGSGRRRGDQPSFVRTRVRRDDDLYGPASSTARTHSRGFPQWRHWSIPIGACRRRSPERGDPRGCERRAALKAHSPMRTGY